MLNSQNGAGAPPLHGARRLIGCGPANPRGREEAMLDLYTAGTNNGQRATLTLEECGLDYRLHKVDLGAGGAHTPDFLKLNPNARIPVLVDSDGPGGKPITVTQSWAICLYAAEKSGRYLPKDPARRIEALSWLFHVATDVAPMRSPNSAAEQIGAKEAVLAFYDSGFREALEKIDRRLGEADYLAGEVSIADFALYPMVRRRHAMAEAPPALRHVLRWEAAMAARPASLKALAA
jgi:GST-like protein